MDFTVVAAIVIVDGSFPQSPFWFHSKKKKKKSLLLQEEIIKTAVMMLHKKTEQMEKCWLSDLK